MQNKLDPDQLPSNSAAGLRSNLFACQPTAPHQKKQTIKVFYLKSILENYPAFKVTGSYEMGKIVKNLTRWYNGGESG